MQSATQKEGGEFDSDKSNRRRFLWKPLQQDVKSKVQEIVSGYLSSACHSRDLLPLQFAFGGLFYCSGRELNNILKTE